MIPGKFAIQKSKVIMKVPRVIQNARIWCTTHVTRRGTLELIIGLKRRNNQILVSLNWMKEMNKSVTFYLLQIDQSVTNIDG